ncbi:hypothetical protein QR685DRAFT_518968 [Neurospora intermedia]|uniref:Uncharacterized protein n=1 Tax=Neurospora intermedia TaxID=5142 RepID=A0ABR3DFF9_NEUIN
MCSRSHSGSAAEVGVIVGGVGQVTAPLRLSEWPGSGSSSSRASETGIGDKMFRLSITQLSEGNGLKPQKGEEGLEDEELAWDESGSASGGA